LTAGLELIQQQFESGHDQYDWHSGDRRAYRLAIDGLTRAPEPDSRQFKMTTAEDKIDTHRILSGCNRDHLN
jgi:hypothetical protein